MKKKIVALVGALSLTFAMSLNVFAAPSVNSGQIAEANQNAGEAIEVGTNAAGNVVVATKESSEVKVNVEVKATQAELDDAAKAFNYAQEKEDDVTEVTATAVTPVEAIAATVAAVQILENQPVAGAKVTEVMQMSAPIDIKPSGELKGKVAVTLKAVGISKPGDGEKILAIDCETGDAFEATVTGEKIYFAAKGFSPYVFTKVKVEAAAPAATNQAPYNSKWDPTSPDYIGNANAAAAAPVAVVAVAPKTGDVVMMVSIMAIIFMAGAAVAVAMSKKRA